MFTVGSLFDGSGTAPLAAELCEMKPVWASEIEPFPVAVTKKRFPKMKHYGDITQIHEDAIEPVDIIVGGSPCQDLSIAGKRAGLQKGERSSLFYEQIRIIREMRERTEKEMSSSSNEFIRPRFGIWENVPGAFSSNEGKDFRCVLEEFCKVKDPNAHVPMPKNGKWGGAGLIVGKDYSVGWRLLDAQYWGVPQRRRRIYLVADFDGQCAGEILFKRQGLSRDFAEIKSTWERSSEGTLRCVDGTGKCIKGCDMYNGNVTGDIACSITASTGTSAGHSGPSIMMTECSDTLHRMGTGGGNTPLILENSNKKFDEKENISSIYCMTTIRKNICFSSQSYYEYAYNTVSSTLKAHGGEYGGGSETIVKQKKLRRLTPQECARLQGFPYWWADDVDGYSDSKAYKMWGNGMALPNLLYVMEGIKICLERLNKEE